MTFLASANRSTSLLLSLILLEDVVSLFLSFSEPLINVRTLEAVSSSVFKVSAKGFFLLAPVASELVLSLALFNSDSKKPKLLDLGT